MWQKIKDNFLTIATSAYFLFWGIEIIAFYIGYKKFEEKKNMDFIQDVLNNSLTNVIILIIILTTLSLFLIFALIRKKKKAFLKIISYFLIPLILFTNIIFLFSSLNGYVAKYLIYGTKNQIEQLFNSPNSVLIKLIPKLNPIYVSIIYNRDEKIIEFLINKTKKVNAIDFFGRTPLVYAVTESSPEIVELLVKNGADVNFQNKKLHNYTPLMESIVLNNKINDKEKIVELLIKAGADVSLQSSDGRKVLDYATILYSKNKDEITLRTIELLLEAGANPFLKPNEKVLSPYEMARKYENAELIELFEKYRDKDKLK
ncbi:MAG: ankyrin repeat domain-containing protein [Alphaproteobacteria bacterium]